MAGAQPHALVALHSCFWMETNFRRWGWVELGLAICRCSGITHSSLVWVLIMKRGSTLFVFNGTCMAWLWNQLQAWRRISADSASFPHYPAGIATSTGGLDAMPEVLDRDSAGTPFGIAYVLDQPGLQSRKNTQESRNVPQKASIYLTQCAVLHLTGYHRITWASRGQMASVHSSPGHPIHRFPVGHRYVSLFLTQSVPVNFPSPSSEVSAA